ncbi:MAG: hypothetical protein IKC94_03975 [Lentisphaeria bacterium]|nr:hypothetical protein [Lentisphaeria bacterium]
MRRLFLSGAVVLFCGCHIADVPPETSQLAVWQQEALERNLDGECAVALQNLARSAARRSHRQDLSDVARFVRENNSDDSAELVRKLLWESVEYCNVQFVRDPALLIRRFRRSEINCRTALLIAERQYLDQIIWKTPAQKVRDRELRSELSSLCGGLPAGDLARIKLVMPDAPLPELPAGLTSPVTEDPAEALQFAAVIYKLPDEIRRQKMADANFYPDCLLNEVIHMAASYALHISFNRLRAAREQALAEPVAENIRRFRQWYFRVQMDIDRLPVIRGEAGDRQFLNSMLLLQDGF